MHNIVFAKCMHELSSGSKWQWFFLSHFTMLNIKLKLCVKIDFLYKSVCETNLALKCIFSFYNIVLEIFVVENIAPPPL